MENNSETISINAKQSLAPAGFFVRGVAVFIDSIITTIINQPLSIIVTLILAPMGDLGAVIAQIISLFIGLATAYFYFGYFYSNKGASPGKMLLGIRVIDTDTGGNLTYSRAFLRETIGRLISTIPLFAGYFIVLFREDRKTFHDLIFNTQVLKKEE